MPKPMIRIHNTETNEIIDREMNEEEFAAYKEQKAIDAASEIERVEKETAKAAIAERLGLTDAELALLLG